MRANDRQVGGEHYKVGGEEHWDRVYRLFGPGYFIGNITKYVERYQSKNGVEDLEKAKHYIEKLIELEKGEEKRLNRKSPVTVEIGDWVNKKSAEYSDTEKEAMDQYAESLRREKLHDDTN